MEARFEYYAFISYSHKDKKWAEWLQRELEHYKLPTSLYKATKGRLPKAIRPIFRDQTDLSVGPLEANLAKELMDSRYLIVICSPESAKSEWVNKEIIHFQKMGRGDRIIPFIVSGEHNSNNEKEIFPPALKEAELLGASLNELSKEQAIIKIVASLLGIKYDVLWDREKREQKKVRVRRSVITLILAILISVSIFLYWDFNYHKKSSYYAKYIELYGVANGIEKLTSEQITSRNMSYKITKLQGKIISIEKMNGSGYLCSDNNVVLDNELLMVPDLPAKIAYSYKDNGDLDKAIYYRKNGQNTITFQYSSLKVANIYESNQNIVTGWNQSLILDSTQHLMITNTTKDVTRFIFDYDNEGKIIKKTFSNSYNTAKSNENGVFAEAYTYDENDRIITIEYLDQSNLSAEDYYGVHKIRYEWNNNGNLIRIFYYSPQNEEVISGGGYSNVELLYDAKGNIIEQKFYLNNELTFNVLLFSSCKIDYDENGNEIKTSFFDISGTPVINEEGYATSEKTYDEKGNCIKDDYFGIDGKPVLNYGLYGYASCGFEYDEKGNEIKRSFFDIKGNLTLIWANYAICEKQYDERSNITKCTYFDTEGKPIFSTEGASIEFEYDDSNNMIREAYFDINGKPVLNELGYSSNKLEYDEKGNHIKSTYYGTDGKLVMSMLGYASTESEYDEKGNEISCTYYGTNGELIDHKQMNDLESQEEILTEQLNDLREEAKEKFRPLETDDTSMIWGKMQRFNSLKMYDMCIECLEMYHEKDTSEEADIFLPIAKEFFNQIDMSRIDYGCMIGGYEPDKPHSSFYLIGDILIEMNRKQIRTYDDIANAKLKDKNNQVKVLRYNGAGFDIIEGEIPVGDSRVLLFNMCEILE